MAEAGWYPDSENEELSRYWDGSAWTDQRRPKLPPASTPTEPESMGDDRVISAGPPPPGWWLASDGEWYPPQQARQPLAPPPPPVGFQQPAGFQMLAPPSKSSNGCLKVGLIVLGVLAVLGIGLGVLFAVALDEAADDLGELGRDATTGETEESTTTATLAEPAAPDASPYVVGFGDLSALSFPAGEPGELTIISTGAQDELSDSVTIIVRNNTSDPIGRIEATGTARDAAGALVGSGSSQGFKPVVVAPGEIAYGYVYFDGGFPEGSSFEFDVAGEEVDTYFRPITIAEINNTGDAIIGGVANDTGVDVTGPISVDVLCFAADGTTIGPSHGFAEQDELVDGATGSFSISLFGNECPIGLAAASGYGSL